MVVGGEVASPSSARGDGKLVVTVNGVDVYDPTTGQIRGQLDRRYRLLVHRHELQRESFFVRHAYFCGDDEPYDKLKRALRAEVDEAALVHLYRTKPAPFDPRRRQDRRQGDQPLRRRKLKVYSV